ncbi:hypothetical protein DIS15_02885 [Levilactobacillus brevis]|uniref:helix-turn-helix transcriptional regulator n=1 Tax=Levilactobacillus brevis TaxID=1580 RepID=UPI001120B464|nr:helix-turn-helix transcriptional regulator [Levilactobacillus brevis]TOY85745.1 hypothetical protein DIS15_02885 [Levilactobacillus brevis]
MPNRIKEERKRLKLTQKELADQLNQFIADGAFDAKPVTYAAVSRWESEENQPRLETWFALAAFFEVEVEYLQGHSHIRQSGSYQYRSTITDVKFSTDSQIDSAIKKALLSIFKSLYTEIDDLKYQRDNLQSQIDKINDHFGIDNGDQHLPKY